MSEYSPKDCEMKYMVVAYDSMDNKYHLMSTQKTEAECIAYSERITGRYSYDYYMIYKDTELETYVGEMKFYKYQFTRMVSSYRCKFERRCPVPLDTLLVSKYDSPSGPEEREYYFK
jgi:hypothetical protein